jgi:hypothetical protein
VTTGVYKCWETETSGRCCCRSSLEERTAIEFFAHRTTFFINFLLRNSVTAKDSALCSSIHGELE